MYDSFNPDGYEDRYFCFKKAQKRWWPEDKNIKFDYQFDKVADIIDTHI